ncbi:hypothetical protein BV898_12616 [Hypsibius exemplaris]|uniref:Uncharacterized protein n=1 Tax=Hypsibius exemplaris TaxID=2072580 RepID=A0A1W0WDB2_HYPEX|nr:hypothetical protein BV898_12616 [Hypsibius exemplaris]
MYGDRLVTVATAVHDRFELLGKVVEQLSDIAWEYRVCQNSFSQQAPPQKWSPVKVDETYSCRDRRSTGIQCDTDGIWEEEQEVAVTCVRKDGAVVRCSTAVQTGDLFLLTNEMKNTITRAFESGSYCDIVLSVSMQGQTGEDDKQQKVILARAGFRLLRILDVQHQPDRVDLGLRHIRSAHSRIGIITVGAGHETFAALQQLCFSSN